MDRTTIPPHALRSGDLLFFDRPSFIQRFSGFVDDEFRGVAVVEVVSGSPVIHLCGRTAGFETRDLAAIIADYDRIAVGRAPDCGCTGRVSTWLSASMTEPNHYPVAALVPAFFLSGARNLEGGLVSVLVRLGAIAGGLAAAWLHRPFLRGRSAYICSTWIAAGQMLACPQHRLSASLTGPKMASTATLGPVWPMAAQPRWLRAVDRMLAEWYLTPSDLWRAVPVERRAELLRPSVRP